MNKIFYTALAFVLGFVLWSCEDDFLDVKNVETGVSVEDMYSRYSTMQGALWEAYSYLPDGFSGLWREAATDVAEATSEVIVSQVFNLGIWNEFFNPDNVWEHNFRGIDQANRFLANRHKVNIDHIRSNSTDGDSTQYFNALKNIEFMEGEALFLKAFFYFELMKRYGGVPIINEPLDYYDASSWKGLDRNTLDETIKYIEALCDLAADVIPESMASYSWYEDGRVTFGAIKALKARTLLYAASPLYKAAGSTVTWADAAAAANEVIKTGQYNLSTSYATLFGASNATAREFIFKRRYGGLNWLEFNQFPISFVGSNGFSYAPTQDFVDQFEVVTGSGATLTSVDFDWDNPSHAEDPYANRDLRFSATVIHNGATFKGSTIETFYGGNDGLPRQNATKTGYYLKKWVIPTVDLVNNTTANHTWCYFRYADILLMYSEAALNAWGPDFVPEAGEYSLTAVQAFNLVRARARVEPLTAGDLDLGRIERERLVELSFEDHRYWDARRWGKGVEILGKPVDRIVITQTETGFEYEVVELEKRSYTSKMDWYPIPQSEITKTGWPQNGLW